MDNRLDFYNYLKEHKQTLTEDDSLLVLAYNKSGQDCILQVHGELEVFTDMVGIDVIKKSPKNVMGVFLELSVFVMDAAVAMCSKDIETAKIMQEELNKIFDNAE